MNKVNENTYPLDGLSIDRASQLANIEYPFTSDSYQSIKGKVKAHIYGEEHGMQANSYANGQNIQANMQANAMPGMQPNMQQALPRFGQPSMQQVASQFGQSNTQAIQSGMYSNTPNAQAAQAIRATQGVQRARGTQTARATQAAKNPNRKHRSWHYLLVAAFAASLVFAVGFVAFNPDLGIWRNWLSYTSDTGDTGLDSLNASVSSIGSQVEDQGIRIELNSALCDGEDTYYMFKITDLEGGRLDEAINLDYTLRASDVRSDGNAPGYPIFTGGAHQIGYDYSDKSITYMIFADDDLVGKNVNIQISEIDTYEPSVDAAEISAVKGSWDFDCTIDDYASVADTGQVNVSTPAGRVFNVVVSPASINLYHEYHEADSSNAPAEFELVYEDGSVVPVNMYGRTITYDSYSVGEGGRPVYDGYTGNKDLAYAHVLDPYNDEFVARSTVNTLIDRIDELKAIRVNSVEISFTK